MDTEQEIPFKEMCARFEVTPRTLRHYEYIELLSPRKEGRSRFFGPREIARMTLIMRGRKFGFSLEEVRQWLLIYDQKGTREQYQYFLDMADRQSAELESQIEALKAARTDLLKLREETAELLAGMDQDGL